jgi:deoxycytidylate deaminase
MLKDYTTTIYPPKEYTMYITNEPCTSCRASLFSAGIKYIVQRKDPSKMTMVGSECGLSVQDTNINDTLKERGSVYGQFVNNADCTQNIVDILISSSKRLLQNYEKEALHMIAHKMSRIVCGKHKKDNWHDIAGYAKLAEDLTNDA